VNNEIGFVVADGFRKNKETPLSKSKHSVMDGDRNKSQKEKDDIADGFLPIGRNG